MIRESNDTITLTLPSTSKVFADKYNSFQLAISQISVVDELLAGMYVTCMYFLTMSVKQLLIH